MRRALQWLLRRDNRPAATPAHAPGMHAAHSTVQPDPVHPPPAAAASAADASAAPSGIQYLAWLTGEPPVDGGITPAETGLLNYLDAIIRNEQEWSALVPRARAIIPQLMHSLRDDNQSVQALSARVARDPNLVVEVLRLASSVGYGTGEPVADLNQAIARLGTDGLRRAIAGILLKPIFDDQTDPLLGRTAGRIWQHAEATAALCVQMAGIARVDAFDAFLAGLMYNVGWTAAFRALGRAPVATPAAMSVAFAAALTRRREVLFAHLVRSWSVNDMLDALADEILAPAPPANPLPIGTLLRSADRAAFLQLLRAPADAGR